MDLRRYIASGQFRHHLLWGFAFTLPIALGISEGLLFIAVLASICLAFRGQTAFKFDRLALIPAALYALAVIAGTILSQRPAVSASKLHRLIFLFLLYLIPAVFRADMRSGLLKLLKLYLFACALSVCYDVFKIVVDLRRGGHIYDSGSMTTPQFYMVAICLIMAVGLADGLWERKQARLCWRSLLLLAINAAGLVLHFKRGVWLASAIAVSGILIAKRRGWQVLALVLLAGALAGLPQVRGRVAALPEEFRGEQGGRWVLWTEVAPRIISEHPLGVGWQALRHEDLAARAEYVQPHLDHLHNNILQITAEIGWLGGALWSVFMLAALASAGLGWWRLRRCGGILMRIALGSAFALLGLLLNGMVENNWDDSEIMLLYCMLMGLSNALRFNRTPTRVEEVGISDRRG